MNPELLEYGWRVTTIWSLLLLYYAVWGRHASFRFQRVVLLGGWVLGLLIPLLPSMFNTVPLPISELPGLEVPQTVLKTVTPTLPVAASGYWVNILPWIYLLGVLVVGIRTLSTYRLLRRYVASGQRSTYQGYTVITSEQISSPFTAHGRIFVPTGLDDTLTRTVLLHEVAHLRAYHHYDKAVMTVSSIFLWFHPLVWIFRRLLATVHEYEADAVVIQSIPARTYGLQLLQCSLRPANGLGLFSSPLKQRIQMITTWSVPRRTRLLPVFTLVLLLGTLSVACSDLMVATSGIQEVAATAEAKPHKMTAAEVTYYELNSEDEAFAARAYLEAFQREIRYPALAREQGLTQHLTIRANVSIDGVFAGDFRLAKHQIAPPSLELTVVGQGTPQSAERTSADLTADDAFMEEIARVIRVLEQQYRPLDRNGKGMSIAFVFDLVFQLEQEV